MTSMIERVAAAIEEEALRQRTSFATWGGAPGIIPALRMNDIARAAIEAMREPTDGMRLASKRYKRRTKVTTGPGFYAAMIDAALKERQYDA